MVFTVLKVDFKTLKLPTLKVIFVHEIEQSDFSLPVKGFEYESSYNTLIFRLTQLYLF